MKNVIYSLGLLVLLTSASNAVAQQLPQFSMYKFNPLTYNPAYAGTRDALSGSLIHRNQWLGMDGAPMTQSLTFHMPITKLDFGIGGSIMHDRIGSTNTTSAFVDYSYQLKLNSNDDKLSFGLKAGIDMFNADFWDRNVQDETDDVYLTSVSNRVIPNFGFGMFLYNEKYFVGLTTPRILQGRLSKDELYDEARMARHFYVMGGYTFELNEKVDFQPTSMIKFTMNAPLSVDLNMDFIFEKKFMVGIMYRVLEGVGINGMVRIKESYRVGYGFNFSTTQLSGYNFGSHELMLGMDFQDKNKPMPAPRFF